MSNRSRLEFNHDKVERIAESPKQFTRALLHYLRTGEHHERDFGHSMSLSYFGVTVESVRNHSEEWPCSHGPACAECRDHREEFGR